MPKVSYNKSALGIGMPRSQVNFEWVALSLHCLLCPHIYTMGKGAHFCLVHKQGYRNYIFVKHKFLSFLSWI